MGFFGKILNGLGFYSDDDLQKIEEKKQARNQQMQEQLANNQPQKIVNYPPINNTIKFFTPSSQQEVIEIVEMLKTGQSARIDLQVFEGTDLFRAIDFLQGACYVLGINPIFENATTILLKQ